MRESLKVLFDKLGTMALPIVSIPPQGLIDDEAIKTAKKIKGKKEKEEFLVKHIKSDPAKYPLSTTYLINLIRLENPQYAYDLAFTLARNYIVDPMPYFIIAEIAQEHKAWLVAKSALEVAEWFSFGRYKQAADKTSKLTKVVSEKINKGEKDISLSSYWKEKIVDKLMVLLTLCYSLDRRTLLSYLHRLLGLFPGSIENYEKVIEITGLVDNSELTSSILNYINNNNFLSNTSKDLFLGTLYYFLLECKKSVSFLTKITLGDKTSMQANYYLALNYLLLKDTKLFHQAFGNLTSGNNPTQHTVQHLFNISTPSVQALFVIWSLIKGTKINLGNISDKEVSIEISRIIRNLLRVKNNEMASFLINQFITIGYSQYLTKVMPYVSELFVKNGDLEKAKELLNSCQDNEAHRILAWVYRLQDKEDLAEEEITTYRKNIDYSRMQTPVLEMVGPAYPEKIPDNEDEVLKLIENIYQQTTQIKKQIALEYGLNQNTCFETGCTDCCTKTYPWVSYTEYLYLRKWLVNQSEELQNKIYKESEKVIENYRKRFKKDPLFLREYSEELLKEYPLDFVFDCPFLNGNLCTAYEVQPFMCRAFGYGSGNRVLFKGCNYYLAQFNAACGLTNILKVIDIFSFNYFVRELDKTLIETNVVAPLPVWFAQSHEETLWKARFNLLSKGIFKPINNFMYKLYFKLLREKRRQKI